MPNDAPLQFSLDASAQVQVDRAMDEAHWRQPGDPLLYRAIAQVWALGSRVVPRHFPPGVHRHRSIDELDRTVEAWSVADFDRRHRQTR